MNLVEKLQKLAAEVRRKRRYAKNEASTRSYLVDPFIQAMGYNVQNPDDVEPEFTADLVSYSEKVDYALKQDGKPTILVEVKSATVSLTHEHTKQLQRYFSTKLDVRFGILTNGLECRAYADLERPNVMDDQPFLTINLQQIGDREAEELNIFVKSEFGVARALSAARTMKYKSRIQRELNLAFSPLSNEFIEIFIRKVYSAKLTKSIRTELTPFVVQGWQDFLRSQEAAERSVRSQSTGPAAVPATNEKKASDQPKTEGAVEIPIVGYLKKGKYAGHRFEAKLLVNEGIDFGQKIVLFLDKVMTPSGALKLGFQRALGEKPSINGWWFWKVIDPATGDERPIKQVVLDEELHRRLLKKGQS